MKKIGYILGLLLFAVAFLVVFSKMGYLKHLEKVVGNIFQQEQPTAPVEQKEKSVRGQIEYAEGLVEKRQGEADGWHSVESGEIVKNGMEIRTMMNSKVVITFEDGSVARMGANGILKLESLGNAININLSQGELYNRVTKNENREYAVAVGDYIIVALGTAFGVEKEVNSDAKVIVVESEVEITDIEKISLGRLAEGEKTGIREGIIEAEEITEVDLDKEFLAWNIKNDEEHFKKKIALKEKFREQTKEREEKEKQEALAVEAAKKAQKEAAAKEAAKKESENKSGYATVINLTAEKDGQSVKLRWSTSGGGAPNGFKVVKSKDPNPVYPGDDYQYFSDPETRKCTWGEFKDGKTYHFRVCTYKDGKCGTYSNDVEVKF